jgi:hypothetical protein
MGTALHAPQLQFAMAVGIGSVGWIADSPGRHCQQGWSRRRRLPPRRLTNIELPGPSFAARSHRWQRLIADLKLLSHILGLIDGLGHDESDRLADKPSLIGRHRVVAGRNRPGASNPRGHTRRTHEPCAMRYGREPIGDIVGARSTASTPVDASAADLLTATILAWACGERTIAACANSGRWTSSAKLPLPVRRRKSSLRRTG